MFLDTSAAVEIFRADGKGARAKSLLEAIGADRLYVSEIQFAELADWCLTNRYNPEVFESHIVDVCNIVPLDRRICVQAAQIKKEMRGKGIVKFGLIDGVILASARSMGEILLTTDTDFRKAEGALVIG